MKSPSFGGGEVIIGHLHASSHEYNQARKIIKQCCRGDYSLLDDQELVESCITFSRKVNKSSSSAGQKSVFIRNYVEMLCEMRFSNAYQSQKETEPLQHNEQRISDILDFARQQQLQLQRLEEERADLRRLNQNYRARLDIEHSNSSTDPRFSEIDQFSQVKASTVSDISSRKIMNSNTEQSSSISLAEAYSRRVHKKPSREKSVSSSKKKSPAKTKQQLFELRKSMMKKSSVNHQPREQNKSSEARKPTTKPKQTVDEFIRPFVIPSKEKKGGKQPPLQLINRLIKGSPAKVNMAQAIQKTKKKYKELPEMQTKKLQEQKKAQREQRLIARREYEREISARKRRPQL